MVTVLAVIAAITSLCALIAQTVRNVIVGRGVVVKELALTVAYLAELCGVVPEVFEFCKSAVTASATEGVSLAIELVVERVLPWAEVSLASFGASLKFGELAFLGPEGGAG